MPNKSTPPVAGPLRYVNQSTIDDTWQTIQERYPSFIGEWIESLYRYSTYSDKCTYGLRSLFESANRFVGLITASLYLESELEKDADFKKVSRVQQQFKKLQDPSTGSWVYLSTYW